MDSFEFNKIAAAVLVVALLLLGLNQIADSMAISRSYVSRIETKAISKLAKEFKE